MSEVKQLDLAVGDEVIYLPNGIRHRVEHIQQGPAGAPETEPTYWIISIGRVPKGDRVPTPVPKALSGVYLRTVTKRPTIGGND